MNQMESNGNSNSQSQLTLNELHHSTLLTTKNDTEMLDYINKTVDILVDYYNDSQKNLNLEHQYLMLTDMNYRVKHSKHKGYMYCNNCSIPKLNVQDSSYVCTQCGETEYLITYQADYNDIPLLKKYTPYHKISYLKERFKQFQSTELAKVPDNVIVLIQTEMDKIKMNQHKCTIKEIHFIMKNIKLHKYYENIQQIYCNITGKRALYIPQQTEQQINQMFKQIEPIYKKLCPKRCKFLSYSYVLNKLFNIINMPDIAKCFNLLKSKKHLREHDNIFKEICIELNWKFYSSFNFVK
jgi:hypothetical protein